MKDTQTQHLVRQDSVNYQAKWEHTHILYKLELYKPNSYFCLDLKNYKGLMDMNNSGVIAGEEGHIKELNDNEKI